MKTSICTIKTSTPSIYDRVRIIGIVRIVWHHHELPTFIAFTDKLLQKGIRYQIHCHKKTWCTEAVETYSTG
jgi:hypothetical protein